MHATKTQHWVKQEKVGENKAKTRKEQDEDGELKSESASDRRLVLAHRRGRANAENSLKQAGFAAVGSSVAESDSVTSFAGTHRGTTGTKVPSVEFSVPSVHVLDRGGIAE